MRADVRTIDDARSQLEARVMRWAAKTGRHIRIGSTPTIDGELVAVVTDLHSGRQGLWPKAWAVPQDEPVETLPLFDGTKKQRSMF